MTEAGQETGEQGTEAQSTEAAKATEGQQQATQNGQDTQSATLASGGTAAETQIAAPQNFPDNWRDLLAGTDKKAFKTLDRYKSLNDLWTAHKDLSAKFDGGKYVQIPGDDATDEESAAFRKALGIPDKADGYVDKLQLANGRVLGDADRPVMAHFAEAMHKVGASQAVMNTAADWYLDLQEAQQVQQQEEDANYKTRSMADLRQEWGGDYKRYETAVVDLFKNAPEEVYGFVASARLPDGRLIGDMPEFLRWAADLAMELNPAAGMPAPDGDSMRAVDTELDEIEKFQREHEEEYFNTDKGKRMQERRIQLLEIREKQKQRAA